MRLIGIFSMVTLAALALQTTLPHLLPIGTLMPDLALVLAVDLGLRHHGAAAALMAFGIGYATDAFSGSQLGLNALLFVLVFLLSYWLARGFYAVGSGLGIAAVFGAVLLCDYGNYLAGAAWPADPSGLLLLPATLLQASITALCAPAVFALLAGLTRAAGLRERSSRS